MSDEQPFQTEAITAAALTLPYVRFVRQVVSGPGSLPQFAAMMQANEVKLKAAAWFQSESDLKSVAMPANQPLTFAMDSKYDAFKMSSTAAAAGVETAYAGMAAYRFKIPADAISGSKYIRALSINVGADKFAYSGVKIAVHATNTATPSTDWAMLRSGGFGGTVDTNKAFATYDADPEVYGVLTGHVANVVDATNQASTLSFDLSGLGNTNYAYLWVYVSMFNYTDYRANRPYWVEGAGIVNGATNVVTFASTVTEDANTAWDGEYVAEGRHNYVSGGTIYGWRDASYTIKLEAPVLQSGQYRYIDRTSQLLLGFPHGSSTDCTTTQSYNDSTIGEDQQGTGSNNTGVGSGSVGIVSATELKGHALARHFRLPHGASVTSLRFAGSSANVLDLSSKTASIIMNVWCSDTANSDMTFGSFVAYALNRRLNHCYNTETDNSVLEQDTLLSPTIFYGASTAKLRVQYGASGSTPLDFTNIGQFTLRNKAYTSSTWFPIASLGSGGVKIIVITLAPGNYWGTVGAATYASFTPGISIYLK